MFFIVKVKQSIEIPAQPQKKKNFFCPDFAFEVSMLLFYFIWRQLKFVKYLTVVVDQDISQPLYFVGQMLNQYFIGIIP